MITVFKVSVPGQPDTHLHLAPTSWGETVRQRLVAKGYAVQPTDRPDHPDTRDAAELARKDALLVWAAPD